MCRVLRREGAEALAYIVKAGQLYVYYKEICCPFEEAFIAQRRGTPYKPVSYTHLDVYKRQP